jgi:Tol biopolymer transport system component
MNADGTGAHDLVSNEGGLTLFAEWSPDGSKILYLSAPPGRTFAVWGANADGTGAHQLGSARGRGLPLIRSLTNRLAAYLGAQVARRIV